jgi:alkylhydroperoxidase family enzyme
VNRIEPLPAHALFEYDEGFAAIEGYMGFVPTSLRTMARVPGLLDGLTGLSAAVFLNPLLPDGLKQLIGNVTSAAGGCRYCQAHTAAHAHHLGIDDTKLTDLWSFETSNHFTDAERAALRLALHAGQHPNATTDTDFATCRRHYTDDQITAIVAVIALFGFLNRWNDTMATSLEPTPHAVADRFLAPQGWNRGNH